MTTNGVDHTNTQLYPVWVDDGVTDVQALFQNPYFVPAQARIDVGQAWYGSMAAVKWAGIFLFDTPTQTNTVWANGPDIYNRLAPGGNMPFPVSGFSGKWPLEALEQLRLWYNQGGRLKKTDPYPGPNTPNPVINPLSPPPPARPYVTATNPVWASGSASEDDIKMCFTNPCWIQGGIDYANEWRDQMLNFQYDASIDPTQFMNLQNYDHVKGWARNIYYHVASQSMPLDPPYFPDEACEAIRLWYNQGCRQASTDPIVPAVNPIQPQAVEKPFRVRKDINTLSPQELQAYRMQILNLNAESLTNSTWQVGGFLHADWCLHYMEASFPWHRAHLLWLESQIKGPIPYWNFFSSKAADPSQGDSGIPQAFLDDTFIGTDNKQYQNPLKYALARNGKSRDGKNTTVQRAPALLDPAQRAKYITDNVPGYLNQVYAATQMTKLGDPQYDGLAFTWGIIDDNGSIVNAQALNDLNQSNNPAFYELVQDQFDGVLEQAHDNFHGWSGPDMANNSFAAFDPLFWSFHANFDRIFENWIRQNNMTEWSSNFPLRPFVGSDGNLTASEGDKFLYEYTTIGQMVVNTKTLGYTFGLPGNPDYSPSPEAISLNVAPVIVFPNVKCTPKTFVIHVALNPTNDPSPLVVGAPGYVGSITRLGMGPNDGNNRCIKGSIVRRLEATKAMHELKIPANSPVPLKVQVIEDPQGAKREVPPAEYKDWDGFTPILVWAKPIAGVKF